MKLAVTRRQRDVLEAAAEGLTAAETARRIFVSVETVRTYRKQAMAALNARNMTHAVAIGLREGVIGGTVG